MKSSLFCFLFHIVFLVYLRTLCIPQGKKGFLLKVLHFTFRSRIYLELIFVYDVRYGLWCISFLSFLASSSSPSLYLPSLSLLSSLSPSPLPLPLSILSSLPIVSTSYLKILHFPWSCLYICIKIQLTLSVYFWIFYSVPSNYESSLLSILYCSFLVSLEFVNPPSLFFFKIILSIPISLHLYINLRIINIYKISLWDFALNLQINLETTDSLTISSLLIYEHNISFLSYLIFPMTFL